MWSVSCFLRWITLAQPNNLLNAYFSEGRASNIYSEKGKVDFEIPLMQMKRKNSL
jgi:hypothetical protein